MTKKRVVILGSTGSIGENTIRVVEKYPEKFEVVGLVARRSFEKLREQAGRVRPEVTVLTEPDTDSDVGDFLRGYEPVRDLVTRTDIDLIVNAFVGVAGVEPTYLALESGTNVALANKETLVSAGKIIRESVRRNGATLIPIDSEHSAVLQCLLGVKREELNKVILTASGGPFRTREIDTFSAITLEDALAHPTWNMGSKITIDSATMMNKGFEVIEAVYLFDLTPDQVDIIIHPQSIVHSLIELRDGSLLAQLGPTDMRIPIQYALAYPDRYDSPVEPFSLARMGDLTFEALEMKRYPCLALALEALRAGGSATLVLNVANDLAVESFLAKRIHFTDIAKIIERSLESAPGCTPASIGEVLDCIERTQTAVREIIRSFT